MEGIQFQLARSAGANVRNVSARSTNNKNLTVGRSVNSPSLQSNYNYETPREQTVVKTKKPSWWNDPERKRKRRVASYKLYAAEAKFKHSMKKGLRWFKIKCIKIVTSI
ncbi:unnamed protein product [Trifolium pratense]|uniref:Uncharacterized protein n=1 Tax=Trifolium pratense TaxID=57577 RepID=A0ACB0IHG2_TRIPR|nr:unnamed protein product [Trifolium pratense]